MLPLTKPNNSMISGDDDEESNGNLHDQLPSVEEIRMASSPRSSPKAVFGRNDGRNRRCGRFGEVAIISLVAILIVTVIGLSVGVAKRGNELDATQSNGDTQSAPPPPEDREPREIYVRQWLDANNVSTLENMVTAGSAHRFAVLWIADEDPMNLALPDNANSEDGRRFVARYVMALVYFGMGGDSWSYQLSFLSEKDVCEWNDIFVASEGVQGRFFRIGVACNNGIINTWQMPGMNMVGTIPEELALLSDLRVVALNNNEIQGTFPQAFRSMTEMDYLALQQNNFVGSIPNWIGDLSNVRVMGLGDNDFDGTIPQSLGTMTDLITLGLDNNKLTGGLSMIQPLTLLRRVYLEGNEFSMTSLGNTFADMVELEELDLSSNRIAGTIPDYLFRTSTLRVLDLHANELDGPIPSDLPFNPVLNYLSLHENLLTGSIPTSIGFMVNLTHLDVSSNVLGGDIPTQLAELTKLRYLFLSSNELTPGPIPTWIGSLTSLEDLSLRETGRFNDFPTQIGLLKNLTLLDAHNNGITGPIPRQLGELPNLRFLILSRNQMTGAVPADFELLTSLEMLMLNYNSFTGSVENICDKSIKPAVFVADCNGEVQCSCCTECCVDTDEACGEMEAIANIDPVWKNSFEREFYEFGSDLIFNGRV